MISPVSPFQGIQQRMLDLINLRPEEQERTLLLFSAYTATTMGILWLDVSSAALFLGQYGAANLPWIYILSGVVGLGLSAIYSWLQRLLPLRRVLVLIALLMALPIIPCRWGLSQPDFVAMTIFGLRLWIEAVYSFNDLNVSVTANQLFNIREIKRAFPIISSGAQIADMISGFSVYLLLRVIGLANVMLLALGVMLVGAALLYYLTHSYEHAFPDSPRHQAEDLEHHPLRPRLQGSIGAYVGLLFSFFVLSQVLLFSTEFQFFNQLELSMEVNQIATFLGIFSGLLGLVELFSQWFSASRLIEKEGVFNAALLLPLAVVTLGLLTLMASFPFFLGGSALFMGLICLKFVDEWLRYTLVTTIRPVLFQPIASQIRATIQSLVGGIAEPLALGMTGAVILAVLQFGRGSGLTIPLPLARFFLLGTVLLALVWVGLTRQLRSRYLDLLVQGEGQGLASVSDADRRAMGQTLTEAMARAQTVRDQQYCIELLSHIAPTEVAEVLAPRLSSLAPPLQRQALEAMLAHPQPKFAAAIRALKQQTQGQHPAVFALALRYLWLVEDSQDVRELIPYLQPRVDAAVRGTAAALMLRFGERQERVLAMATLRKMLVHDQERERVMGCRALTDATYMESLSIYIDKLLQDPSLPVRRAILGAIAATQYSRYYPALFQALRYKSTRSAARRALVSLGDEVLPLLQTLGLDSFQPHSGRQQAWQLMGEIGSLAALETLVRSLAPAWGSDRQRILAVVLKIYQETGVRRSPLIDTVLDRELGRSGLEQLIHSELTLLAELLAAQVDLQTGLVAGLEADLLARAVEGAKSDATNRLLMVLRLVSPVETIQAAQGYLTGSASRLARGLEILDHTLTIASKKAILILLDRRPAEEKLRYLSLTSPNLYQYCPLSPRDRLRRLLDLRHLLCDWTLACCFHVARANHWSLASEPTLALLNHPTGFVREAVLSYVATASPRALQSILPLMQADPNPLVVAQVNHLMATYNLKG